MSRSIIKTCRQFWKKDQPKETSEQQGESPTGENLNEALKITERFKKEYSEVLTRFPNEDEESTTEKNRQENIIQQNFAQELTKLGLTTEQIDRRWELLKDSVKGGPTAETSTEEVKGVSPKAQEEASTIVDRLNQNPEAQGAINYRLGIILGDDRDKNRKIDKKELLHLGKEGIKGIIKESSEEGLTEETVNLLKELEKEL